MEIHINALPHEYEVMVLQTRMQFLYEYIWIMIIVLLKFVSKLAICDMAWNKVSILSRWQIITWSHYDLVHWYIYAAMC